MTGRGGIESLPSEVIINVLTHISPREAIRACARARCLARALAMPTPRDMLRCWVMHASLRSLESALDEAIEHDHVRVVQTICDHIASTTRNAPRARSCLEEAGSARIQKVVRDCAVSGTTLELALVVCAARVHTEVADATASIALVDAVCAGHDANAYILLRLGADPAHGALRINDEWPAVGRAWRWGKNNAETLKNRGNLKAASKIRSAMRYIERVHPEAAEVAVLSRV